MCHVTQGPAQSVAARCPHRAEMPALSMPGRVRASEQGLLLPGPASRPAASVSVRGCLSEACLGSLPCPSSPGVPARGLGGRAVTQVPGWEAGAGLGPHSCFSSSFLPTPPGSPPHTQCFSLQPSLPEGSRVLWAPREKRRGGVRALRGLEPPTVSLHLPSGLAPPRPPRRPAGRCLCCPPPGPMPDSL